MRGLRQWRLQYSAPQAAGGHETRPYETTKRWLLTFAQAAL